MKTIVIKHVDGKTNIKAKVLMFGSSINLEYKYQGMTYGRELTLSEAYELGIIENKNHKEKMEIKKLNKEKRSIEMDRHFIGVISKEKANRLFEIENLLTENKK